MNDEIHDRIEASQGRLIKDTEATAVLTVLLLRDGTTACSVTGKKAYLASFSVCETVSRMVMRAVNAWHALGVDGRGGDLTPEAFENECKLLAAQYRLHYLAMHPIEPPPAPRKV